MTPLCPHCLTAPRAPYRNRQPGFSATCCAAACVRAARREGGLRTAAQGGALVSDPAILDRPPGRLAARLAQISDAERRFVAW